MTSKVGAYGAQDVGPSAPSRFSAMTDLCSRVCTTQNSGRDGKWDLAVFAERAKEKDKEASDRAKENEAAMLKGK